MSRLLSALILIPVALAAGGCGKAKHAAPSKPYSLPDGATIVRGWADITANVPVVGAEVRVETIGGEKLKMVGGVDASWAVTNERGAFGARVRDLPAHYVVVVSGGGLPVPLRAVADRGPTTITDVNLATTVLALRVKAHPAEPRATATAKVQHLLSIPAWDSLDEFVNASDRRFDGRQFLEVAAAHGKVSDYLDQLVHESDQAAPTAHSFVPKTNGIRMTSSARVSDDLVGDAAGFIFSRLAAGVIGGVGSTLLGEVLSKVGLGTVAQLNEIQDSINSLQDDLTTINTELATINDDYGKLSTALVDDTYTQETHDLKIAVTNSAEAINKNIRYIADNPGDPGNAALATTDLGLIQAQILGGPADDIDSDMTNGAGSLGALSMMTLAQQDFYANLPSAPFVIDDTLNAEAQTVYKHWAYDQSLITMELTEYYNSINQSSSFLTTVVNDGKHKTANWLAQIQPVPPAGTMVDTRTNLMWTLPLTPTAAKCGTGWPTTAQQLWTSSQVQFHAPSPTSPIYPCGNATVATLPIATAGFTNWGLPGEGVLAAMISGWSGVSVNAWLTATLGASVVPDLSALNLVPASPANTFTRSEWDGTEWSVWTNHCIYDGTPRAVTNTSRNGPAVEVRNLTYCNVLDLGDGNFTNECIADFAPQYPGCDAPIATGVYDGFVSRHTCDCGTFDESGATTDQRFDYFHSNVVLAQRPLATGETYWLSAG